MQTHSFKLKPLRTLGIMVTCGVLAVGCAGNSVKPMSSETGPIATAPEAKAPVATSDTKPIADKPMASTASTDSETNNTPADTTPSVADNSAGSGSTSNVSDNSAGSDTTTSVENKSSGTDSTADMQQPTQMSFYFGFNKTELNDQDKATLKEHARFLKANPSLVLEINGHTDNKGPHAYNEFLSKLRAESVAKVLIGEGIARSQLVINALADDKPLSDNTDPGKNRRVELQYDETNMLSTK